MSGRHTKPTDRDLLGVVDAIYAASVDPGEWMSVLRHLVGITGGEIAGLVAHRLSDGDAAVQCLFGTDEHWRRAYEHDWAPRNIYLHGSGVAPRPGAVRLSHQLVPLSQALRTDYVNDFLVPAGVLHIMGSVLSVDAKSAVILHVLRSRRVDCFDRDEVRTMETLMPHLRRADTIRRRLGDTDLRHRAAVEGLDRLAVGVLFLDERGATTFANRAADRLLAQSDGLGCRGARLGAADPGESAALERAVAVACRAGGGAPSGATLLISRPSGRQPFVVTIATLTREVTGPWASGPAAIVFVTDPHATAPELEAVLRHLYGLTPAEAKVARLLVDGDDIDTMTDRLGVTVNTARTHVKHLLGKTNTRSQRELVQVLLAATMASLPADGNVRSP